MALVPIRIDRTSKPPLGTPLRSDGHWSVQGLIGVYGGNEAAGTRIFDAGGIYHSTAMLRCECGPDGIVFNGTTAAGSGAQIGASPVLGGLSESSVFVVFKTTSPAVQIANSGDAIYSERAPTGNDIYKIALVNLSGVQAEFTYRNDAGALLQQRVSAAGSNDGGWHTAAIIKRGTAHTICYESVSSTGTYGGTNTNFTNANMKCLIGGDGADANATWGGGATGAIGNVYRYSQALSLDQYYSLRANPWQVYEPEIVWVEVGGNPSAIAGTASQVIGAFGQVATSALLVSGQSAQTLSGVSQTATAALVVACNHNAGLASYQQTATAVSAIAGMQASQLLEVTQVAPGTILVQGQQDAVIGLIAQLASARLDDGMFIVAVGLTLPGEIRGYVLPGEIRGAVLASENIGAVLPR